MKKIGIIVAVICAIAITAVSTSLIFLAYQTKHKITANPVNQTICQQPAPSDLATSLNATSTIEKSRGKIMTDYILETSRTIPSDEIDFFTVETISTSSIACNAIREDGLTNCSYNNYKIIRKSDGKKFKVSDVDFFSKNGYSEDCSVNFISADKINIYADITCYGIGGWSTGELVKYNPETGTKENYVDNTFGYNQVQGFLLVRTQNTDESETNLAGLTNFVLIDLQNQTKTTYHTNWTCEKNSTNVHFDCSEIAFSVNGPNWADAFYLVPMLYDGQESKIYKFGKDGIITEAGLTPDDLSATTFWR